MTQPTRKWATPERLATMSENSMVVADAVVGSVRKHALDEVMAALKQERARMTRSNGYTLANVYGMNNAVDIVAKMIGEAQ